MSRSGSSIEVLSGTCLPATEYVTRGAIPVGVEVTEQMNNTSITDPDFPLDMQTALYRYASGSPRHKQNRNLVYMSGNQLNSATVQSRSSPSNSIASTDHFPGMLKILLARQSRQRTTDALASPLSSQSLHSVEPNLPKTDSCYHFRSSEFCPRSPSVGHLACLIRGWRRRTKHPSMRRHSLPTLAVEAITAAPFGVRSAGDGQTDEEQSIPELSEVRNASPVQRIPITVSTGNRGSITSPTVWWLDDSGGGSGTVNRKAIFTLDTSPTPETVVFETESNEDTAQHLLLPGRSEFEDELVREVAHFELTEFLIGELEFLNSMSLMQSIFPDDPVVTEENPCLTSIGTLDYPLKSPTLNPEHSESTLGWLTYIDPKPMPGLSDAYPTVKQLQNPTRISSPFADFFGVIQQGLPTELPPSTDHSPTQGHFDSDLPTSAEDDLSDALVDSLQTRFVTTAGAELITSCMEHFTKHAYHMAFLKQLHQLLMQTCDADWAFRDRSPCWTTKPQDKQLLTSSTLVPSTPAVMLISRENNHKADLVPLMPAHLSRVRQRSRSTAVVDGALLKPVPNCRAPSPLQLVNGVVSTDSSKTESPSQNPAWSNRLECTVENDFYASTTQTDQPKHSPISALCTPLPYELLLTPPVPKAKRKAILAGQNNRCAGCGTFIETRYLKRMRFCEFFGRYFCCVCHANTLMVLPGNLLTNWDFRMMPVCNIARDRLHQLHRQPLLRWSDFNRRVIQSQPCLRSCHTLRNQGRLLLPFVRFCQDAHDLIAALTKLPPHWLQTPDIWSMADLCTVRDGQLEGRLRMALQPMVDHLSGCPRCRAQGYVCEVCHSGHILFPFGQANTVMCPVCSACFHRSCLRQPKPETCPRCIRRNERRKRTQLNARVPNTATPGENDEQLMLSLG